MPLKWMIWIDLGVPPWKCPYGNMPWEKGTGTTQMNWSILEEFLRTSGTTAWVWWSNLFAKKMRCCRCRCCRFHFLQCFSIHWKRSDVPISMSSAGAALPPEDGTGDAGGNQLQCHGCWCHRCHLTISFFPPTFAGFQPCWEWLFHHFFSDGVNLIKLRGCCYQGWSKIISW